MSERILNLNDIKDSLEKKLGRKPDVFELVDELIVYEEKVNKGKSKSLTPSENKTDVSRDR